VGIREGLFVKEGRVEPVKVNKTVCDPREVGEKSSGVLVGTIDEVDVRESAFEKVGLTLVKDGSGVEEGVSVANIEAFEERVAVPDGESLREIRNIGLPVSEPEPVPIGVIVRARGVALEQGMEDTEFKKGLEIVGKTGVRVVIREALTNAELERDGIESGVERALGTSISVT